MITYRNHHLVPFDSACQKKTPIGIIGYKYLKCNCVINKTISEIEADLREWHWMFDDGKDHDDNFSMWYFLNLTCEEEQIKKLLE